MKTARLHRRMCDVNGATLCGQGHSFPREGIGLAGVIAGVLNLTVWMKCS